MQRTMPVFLHTLYQTLIHYIGGNGTTNVLKSIIDGNSLLFMQFHGDFNHLGIVIVGVYSTMKCRLHPLSQVECCVSHLSCRAYHVGCTMSHLSCRVSRVAVTYDMCTHATHMTGDILRFIRYQTFLTEKV